MSMQADGSLRHGSATALWQALIRDGEQRRHLVLGETLQAYLVFALMRHLGDAALTSRTMAVEWLQALEPPLRPDRLRDVGDRCLLIAGLFPRIADRRRVSHAYYVDIGRGAYACAAQRAPACERGLFADLTEAFASLVDVLAAIRPDAPVQSLVASRAAVEARLLH